MQQSAPAQSGAAMILIVDDSPTQAKLLEQLLGTHGYRICVARNVSEALGEILAHRPDLVISDILMPEMDGFELCRQVRGIEEVKGTPIILLTHLNDPADVLHSLESGANYFVSKPYSNRLLLSRISAVLQGNRACLEGEADGEVAIRYHDKSYLIHATHAQTIELLLATYEFAAEKNQELLVAKQSLSSLNRELEQRVKERTAALTQETAERLQAMEELCKKDEVLIQQSRMAAMGEMLGNIAHQWRQPLNVLGLYVQDLRMSYKSGRFSEDLLDNNVTKSMEIIQHMSQTIDDFQDFLGLDKEKRLFKVDQVIKKSVSLIEASLMKHNVSLEINSSGEPQISGHPNEYGQVFINILMNAKDAFVERGKSDARITVRSWTENGRAVVTITDNAGGIKEEIIDKIFDAYFTTKALGKGTGVGLFMSNAIIEKSMGGRLTVRNVEGGVEFRIEV